MSSVQLKTYIMTLFISIKIHLVCYFKENSKYPSSEKSLVMRPPPFFNKQVEM